MNTRIKHLPANTLVQTLKSLQDQITALKQGQRISGQSGVISYETTNDDTWDLTGTVGTSSDTDWHATTVTVTWVGDGSQEIAFANVAFSLFVNGTVSANQLTPQNHTYTSGSQQAEVSYLGETGVSFHTYTVQFGLLTYQEITYYIKGYAEGSCPGTISVSAVLES